MRGSILGLLLLFVTGEVAAEVIVTDVLPTLAQPVSNNAVTLISTADGLRICRFRLPDPLDGP